MSIVDKFTTTMNRSLETFYGNENTTALFGLFLVLYAGLVAPKLPKSVAKIFSFTVFRLIFLFLIVDMSRRNTSLAIIATVALVISMQTLSHHQTKDKMNKVIKKEIEDGFENIDSENGEIVEIDDETLTKLHEEDEYLTSVVDEVVGLDDENLHASIEEKNMFIKNSPVNNQMYASVDQENLFNELVEDNDVPQLNQMIQSNLIPPSVDPQSNLIPPSVDPQSNLVPPSVGPQSKKVAKDTIEISDSIEVVESNLVINEMKENETQYSLIDDNQVNQMEEDTEKVILKNEEDNQLFNVMGFTGNEYAQC